MLKTVIYEIPSCETPYGNNEKFQTYNYQVNPDEISREISLITRQVIHIS